MQFPVPEFRNDGFILHAVLLVNTSHYSEYAGTPRAPPASLAVVARNSGNTAPLTLGVRYPGIHTNAGLVVWGLP